MFTASECLAWWKNVDDLSGAFTLTLLNGDRITKLIVTFINWSKVLCEILSIVPIELIVLIDALSIADVFSDRYALIRLKRDNPETQKLLWLHHIDRTPDQGLAT